MLRVRRPLLALVVIGLLLLGGYAVTALTGGHPSAPRPSVPSGSSQPLTTPPR